MLFMHDHSMVTAVPGATLTWLPRVAGDWYEMVGYEGVVQLYAPLLESKVHVWWAVSKTVQNRGWFWLMDWTCPPDEAARMATGA
jgi:hypothetical protein